MNDRLLLVDDNPRFLDAARGLLEREGLTVVAVASTTRDALARVDDVHPDVVLVDVDLGGESGFDLAARLRRGVAADAPPAVILISTYAEEDLKDLIDTSPAAGFLSKAELSATAIRRLLARPDEGG